MSLKLSDFDRYTQIVIQCHDNPDADALASGFALKRYLEQRGKEPRFVYGGTNPIAKSNLVLMNENLEINCEHIESLETPELLITVDCQYGESNVTAFPAQCVAVIDHHQVSSELPEMSEVRSNYGSCSTVLYEMLRAEDFDINADRNIATALYYGLMTDTGDFTEISHPCDKDLRDIANFNKPLITLFRNSNLSIDELRIAGDALKNTLVNEERFYGIVEAGPCDSNILGIISDMFLEVDGVQTCVVYNILPSGVKFSVRSCVKEVKASELASFLAEGLGGGGGHLVKAGGFLKKDLIVKSGVRFEREAISSFFRAQMNAYFDSSTILTAGEYQADLAGFSHYRKKMFRVGYVRAAEFAEAGKDICIRTLEGDVDVTVTDDLYIILNVNGEIYPIRQAKFEHSYRVVDEPYVFPGEYPPNVIDNASGERVPLLPFARSCVSVGGDGIYAKEITGRVKVFTAWDPEKYYLGRQGDMLAVRADDTSDIYVIEKSIFAKTYEPYEEKQ
ncbi:MAG: DHH family phosphoesterase [Lachnospiraceae bacterium]|nr:DHH family phosphoesterase [Lachnospiraceae bacterium]